MLGRICSWSSPSRLCSNRQTGIRRSRSTYLLLLSMEDLRSLFRHVGAIHKDWKVTSSIDSLELNCAQSFVGHLAFCKGKLDLPFKRILDMWRDERDKLREDKAEYLRNNRDYSYLLEDEEGGHSQPQQSPA